ncbi:hypothetical protein KMC60_gp01 [Achromobacter phage vB_AxyP_19-32_Axy11]|uniref:Uncharacterized protein n=2 Tax=Pourcelvirus Axy11 TaxID=2843622 RepID=A0A514CVY2_9CAUD|nr:hypothetical protein KMC60_gp01 [Achromobacter phage vB_AxyP_19-32_Axy11]QDH84044.1 hypothetical protein Axy11_001 [Achromobacter phage vB_AxyP_19-32_Axy11]QDH84640.1 hypothetical protein Axy22_001 [Achromobacter phage vB_AxyP_19-32_Axy22]
MSVATTRVTFGAVLGTINEAATTVSSTFGTATKAVGMLNTFVSAAADKQALRTKVDLHEFKTRLIEEKSMEEARRKVAIEDFCKDEVNAKHFKSAYDRLSQLVNNETKTAN